MENISPRVEMNTLKKAEEKGKELGLQEGKELGFQEGKKKMGFDIAIKMTQQGFSIEQISLMTDLSQQEIEQLQIRCPLSKV